ncbi:MAG: class I SAM-dependent methyltransferase [Microgenomates group bacterium]
MAVYSLIKDPPLHRHSLAKPHFLEKITSILDVGGISFKKHRGKWYRDVGAPKDAWGVTHILDKKTSKPHIFTINVTRDYDHNDRKPDMYYDGLHIPFADSSYDIVTSIDVLEHVPKDERPQLISEMIRVSKYKTIIVCPFYCLENVKMEEDILADMKEKNILPKPSLKEHREFELPKISDLEKTLTEKNLKYSIHFGTNRKTMEKYYFFQNSINSLLHISHTSKDEVKKLLDIVMHAAGSVFNMANMVEKKDAYRVILSIVKQT